MNNLLYLKGRFEQAPNSIKPPPINLPVRKFVDVIQLEKLRANLVQLRNYWSAEDIISGALVSVYYNKVAAKSNRIRGLLVKGGVSANSSIVGARFSDGDSPKHIITHYVDIPTIDESIARLSESIFLVHKLYNGRITHDDIKKLNTKEFVLPKSGIAKTNFIKVIIDAYYVEKFDVLIDEINLNEESLITIYRTNIKATKIMEKIGINLMFNRVMDDTTILLRPDELQLLKQKAPYLISMAVTDIRKLTRSDFDFCDDTILSIPPPTNESTIGVIDTMFDKSVYFSQWVEFKNMLPEEISISAEDFTHGTAVSSIIVDGPSFNPHLNDGCGRFRVRHFGVASGGKFSSFTILRDINEIISLNKDIKVWNLSLGSNLEINSNFISPEAAILDRIQYENDVIFIIAGTNKDSNARESLAIGAPADSINSLVVNSVSSNNHPASYSRKGPVLSFFTKPDVSYYGGDSEKAMRVCTSLGERFVCGTSFAAPWIARKMSYLIDVLGLSREVAKALLINSATSWSKQEFDSSLIGHGIVPIHINSIVHSSEDEIQFILSGVKEMYDTYNFNIPIPLSKEKYPFITKVTLCYFPWCSRNQGVDYTNTELEIQFGRVTEKGIKPIDNNYQSSLSDHYTWEEDARKFFRKWDNVKHIQETLKKGNRAKKSYGKGTWGISLKTKERLEDKYGVGIKFGVVVTIKEIDGKNRIDDFIKNCSLRGWLVHKIDIDNRIDIYNIAEEEIEFKD